MITPKFSILNPKFLSKLSPLDIIAPTFCVGCLSFAPEYLCEKCAAEIPIFLEIRCPHCLKIYPDFAKRAVCPEHRQTTSLDGLLATTFYEGKAKVLLHFFKYQGVREIASVIANYMAKTLFPWEQRLNEFTLTPIPLSKQRLKERGYNQAELIALALSVRFSLPIVHCLKKTRETKSQAKTQNISERLTNLTDCFEATHPPENVLLIDDVRTTGTTLEEAAKALKQAGAKRVFALVFAITK